MTVHTVIQGVTIKDCMLERCTIEQSLLNNVVMTNSTANYCMFSNASSNDISGQWKKKAIKILHDPKFDVNKILVDAVAYYLMHNPMPE